MAKRKLPYFKWTYSYKEGFFELFSKKAINLNLKEPYDESDIFSIFQKITKQKTRTLEYKSFLKILDEKKIKVNNREFNE